MNKAHYLRPIKYKPIPQYVLYIDTETNPNQISNLTLHTARLGWICLVEYDKKANIVNEQWKRFFNGIDICEAILEAVEQCGKIMILASNAVFDLGAISFFNYFANKGFKLEFYKEKGLMFILIIKKDNLQISIASIQNFIPSSIKRIGKLIGKEKIEIDVFTDDMDLLSIYCFRDVEILLEGFTYYLKFITVHEMGGFGMTVPGQSFRCFRYRFMKDKILIHMNAEVAKLERSGYQGGRCEAFRIGRQKEQNYYQLDVNSMYPKVMSEYNFPINLQGKIKPGNMKQFRLAVKLKNVTARVLINTNEPVYPKVINNRTCFPIGVFWTTLNTGALRYAIEHGHLEDYSYAVCYNGKPIFKEFMKELWETRLSYQKDKNIIMATVCKLFMNGLYGKWAERHEQVLDKVETNNPNWNIEYWYDEVKDMYGQTIEMFYEKLVLGGLEETQNGLVTISGHITEYARLLLWKYMKIAGLENVYYTDTDSLIVNEETYFSKFLPYMNDELGMLKVEKIASRLELYGAKDYILGDKTVLKGIHKNLSPNEKGKYEVLTSYSLKSLMKNGYLDCAVLKTVEKELKRVYNKGIISDLGMVIPFPLYEPQDSFCLDISNLPDV